MSRLRTDTIFQKEGYAHIRFPINGYELLPDLGDNCRELNKIENTAKMIWETPEAKIESISIEVYAFPEGNIDLDMQLSEDRAVALCD